jgi:hypothetical protein
MPRVRFTNLTEAAADVPAPAGAASLQGSAGAPSARRVGPAAKKGPRKYDAAMIEGLLRTLRNNLINGAEAGVSLMFSNPSDPNAPLCIAKFTKKSASALAGTTSGGVVCKPCDKCLKKYPPGAKLEVRARANKKKGKLAGDGRRFVDGPWSDPPVPFTA